MQDFLTIASARLRRQLEHRTCPLSAAKYSCTEEVAGGIDDQPGQWRIAVPAVVVEGMQNILGPASARCGCQLEGYAHTVKAAPGRCAEEVSGEIERQASPGLGGGLASIPAV